MTRRKIGLTEYDEPNGFIGMTTSALLHVLSSPTKEEAAERAKGLKAPAIEMTRGGKARTVVDGYVPHFEEAVEWALQSFSKEDADTLKFENLCDIGIEVVASRIDAPEHMRDVCKHILETGEIPDGVEPHIMDQFFFYVTSAAVQHLLDAEESLPYASERLDQGDQRWHAAQIAMTAADIREGIDDSILFEERRQAGEDLNETPWGIRHNANLLAQQGFILGFLFRDAWWKFKHEAAALKSYEFADKNRANGKLGGRANIRKERYEILDGLAGSNPSSFAFLSDRAIVRRAKQLAANYDRDHDTSVFVERARGLSTAWFEAWATHFRELKATEKVNENGPIPQNNQRLGR